MGQSGQVLIMAYIGGVGHFMGPIIGAVLITLLNGVLSDLTEAWFLYLGMFFVIIVMFAPGGLAGMIMMHEPIWKTDVRLMREMAVPYAAALGATLLALAGIVGLIEIIYFLSTASTAETAFVLYGIDLDVTDVVPWILCTVMAAVGVYACRATYPAAAAAWNAAIDQIKARATL